MLHKRFGQEPNTRDIIWFIFNQLIIKKVKEGKMPSFLYYEMALFTDEEGKYPASFLETCAEMNLKTWSKLGVVKVKIKTAGEKACEHCKKLQGMVLDINEAFRQEILPCKSCTHHINSEFGFCRCHFSSVVDTGITA